MQGPNNHIRLTCGATFSLPSEAPDPSATKPLPLKEPPPIDKLSAISAPSSVGELLANCEAKLMNDAGTAEVPQGASGELWVRGPIVMKGYWRNKAATQEILTSDGWLITGDICYVDPENNFHIVDRKKASFLLFISSYIHFTLQPLHFKLVPPTTKTITTKKTNLLPPSFKSRT